MAATFPHVYDVRFAQKGHDTILTSGVRPPLVGGPPPEFGGQPEWWSPEHLLVSSVGLCFTATFRALAARTDLSLRSYAARVEGVLDKTAAGLEFVSFTIHVALEVGPGQSELTAGLLGRAKKGCLVAKSLRAPVEVRPSIEETSAFVLEEAAPAGGDRGAR